VNEHVGPRTAEEIVSLIAERWKRGDLEAIAELVHPEAEVESVAAPGRVLRGRAEYLEAIRSTFDSVWLQKVERVESMSDTLALTVATIRYPLPEGGHGVGRYCWLDEVREGMLWRVKLFATPEQARAAIRA
jgi:hypothetical protein